LKRNQIESAVGSLRYVSLIAVISAGFGSALMFLIGAVKIYNAYAIFMYDGLVTGSDGVITSKQTIAYLVQGIDAFLIALVFMIFSGGVYNLFIRRGDLGVEPEVSHTRIQSISQLKSIIAELIVIILFVNFMEDVLASDINTYQWEMLVIPSSILFLAGSLKLLDLKDR
jgi:uncharacterized membrane protein YqhA